MSCVDEARRRAAEFASPGTIPGGDILRPLPLSDASRLTIEAFPLETPASSPVQPRLEANKAPRLTARSVHAAEPRPVDAQEPNGPDVRRPDWPSTNELTYTFVGAAAMSQASEEQYRLLGAALHNMQ